MEMNATYRWVTAWRLFFPVVTASLQTRWHNNRERQLGQSRRNIPKEDVEMNATRKQRFTGLVAGILLFSLTFAAPVQAATGHASGGGTYFVGPDMLSEFQLSQSHVQCKVGHAVMTDGTVMQMRMFSTSVDSVTIDSAAKTVTITGSMLSIVVLRFTDGTSATLTENVPYTAFAQDNATPGAGADTFSLTVLYVDTPALDQFDLFGSPAVFAGTVQTGDVTVR
jgi:hypothetical protein